VTTYRERDARCAVRDLLDQSGVFDGVYLSGLPQDRGERCGDANAVAIEPMETTESDPWDDVDGDLVLTCRLGLTILARHEDPQVRDETAERLLNMAANALFGNTLGGLALPSMTRIRSWNWQKPRAPERRISAVLEFQYLVSGWNEFNIDE
jgi:hypothetical protein